MSIPFTHDTVLCRVSFSHHFPVISIELETVDDFETVNSLDKVSRQTNETKEAAAAGALSAGATATVENARSLSLSAQSDYATLNSVALLSKATAVSTGPWATAQHTG